MAISGIDLGDAVLRFTADLTDLNAAIAQINSTMPAALKPSGDAVAKLGQGFAVVGTSASQAGVQMGGAAQQVGGAAQQMGMAAAAATALAVPAQKSADAGKSLADAYRLMPPVIQHSNAELLNMAFSLRNIKVAEDEVQASTRGMTERFRVAEEAVGIRLPRGVNSFLATLPGLSTAIDAAFDASVVFFLVSAIAQGATALSNWLGSILIMTQAQKDADAAFVKLNASTLANETALKASKKALDDYGMSATELAQVKIKDLEKELLLLQAGTAAAAAELKKANAEMKGAIDTGTQTGGWSFTDHLKAAANEAQHLAFVLHLSSTDVAKDLATATAAAQNAATALHNVDLEAQRKADDIARARKESADAYRAEQLAALENSKTIGEAQLSLEKSRAQASVAFDQNRAASLLVIDAQYAEKSYQLEFSALQQREAILAHEGDKTLAERKKINADIEKLEYDHTAKLISDATRLSAQFAAVMASVGKLPAGRSLSLADQLVGSDFHDKFAQAEAAATALGITLSGTTVESVDKAKTAFTQLVAAQKLGAASSLDVKNAQIALDKELIDNAKILGLSEEAVKALRTELAQLDQKSVLDQLQATTDKLTSSESNRNGILAQVAKSTGIYQNEVHDATIALEKQAEAERQVLIAERARVQEQIAAAKAAGQDTTALQQRNVAMTTQINQLGKVDKALKQQDIILSQATSSWEAFFKALENGSLRTGQAIEALGVLTAQGIGASVTAAVGGASSFGQAMEQMLKSALAALAGEAVVQAIKEIAKAFSDFATAATMAADPFTAALAPGFVAAGNAHLIAAAKWGVVGAGAAIGGAALSSGSSSSSTGAAAAAAPPESPAQTAAPQPIQTINVQKLATGGITLGPTLALIGDAIHGGAAREAVIPLDSSGIMEKLGGQIGKHVSQPQISADNLPTEAIHRIVIASLTGRSPENVPTSLLPSANRASVPTASQPTYRAAVPISSGQSGAMPPEVHNHTHLDNSVKVEIGSFATLDPKRDAKIVVKEINKGVKNGTMRLTSNTTFRVTKRG